MTASAEILPPVTDTQKAEFALSPSRNDCCANCNRPFKEGETRFPIWGYWILEDLGGLHIYDRRLISVCGKCFLAVDKEEVTDLPRYDRPCNGCGEPLVTPVEGVFRWTVCSNRCYQRAYRKRRRAEGGSTIPWRWSPTPKCTACKKPMPERRKDARFCSARCKQWAHRRRKT